MRRIYSFIDYSGSRLATFISNLAGFLGFIFCLCGFLAVAAGLIAAIFDKDITLLYISLIGVVSYFLGIGFVKWLNKIAYNIADKQRKNPMR